MSRFAIIKKLGKTGVFLGVVILAAAVGGFGAGWVHANIPDNNGTIHSCYSTDRGSLYIIDNSTQTCGTGETGLNWDQASSNIAYATVPYDSGTNSASLDTAHSKGITNFQTSSVDSAYECLTVSFTPKFVFSPDNTNVAYTFKDSSGNWVDPENMGYTNQCDSITGTNLVVGTSNSNNPMKYVIY